jgi:hypothetical protein
MDDPLDMFTEYVERYGIPSTMVEYFMWRREKKKRENKDLIVGILIGLLAGSALVAFFIFWPRISIFVKLSPAIIGYFIMQIYRALMKL